jgi:DNA-binding NtrC family response regulator
MSKPDSSMKVLYGEQNEQIQAARVQTLQKAGFSVQTAIGRKAIQEALKQTRFDLVILGQTLSRDDRHHLPYMVKKANQTTKVLVMHTDGSRHHYVDAYIDTGSSMDELLRKITSLQQPQTAKTMAAGAGK